MKNFFENLCQSLYDKAYDAAVEYHGGEDNLVMGYHAILYYPTIRNFKLSCKAKVVYFREI
jgi:hypothetical protein